MNLAHLATDCPSCRNAVNRGWPRGTPIADTLPDVVEPGTYTGTERIGNCSLCRNLRLTLIESWTQWSKWTTSELIRCWFASAQSDHDETSRYLTRRHIQWWLQERTAAAAEPHAHR